MIGGEIDSAADRLRSLATPSSVAASSSTPDTVPYAAYAELCRECDNLHGMNDQLRALVDSTTNVAPRPLKPTSAARIRTLIQTATDQLEQMPPPTSVKYGEGRMLVQMMIDELQRIVDRE